MSLDTDDLKAIRQIVYEVVYEVVQEVVYQIVPPLIRKEIAPLEAELKAQGNDIREIYGILQRNNIQIIPSA